MTTNAVLELPRLGEWLAELPPEYRDRYTIEWHKVSNYADVFGLICCRHRIVAKRLKVVIERGSAVESAVERINRITLAFRQLLTDHGVRVPLSYETFLVPVGNHMVAWHISSYEGLDYSAHLNGSTTVAVSIADQLITMIRGVLEQPYPTVGLDPRLSNFASGDSPVYFDLFPPLCSIDGQTFVHFPNPTDADTVQREILRKFLPEGIIRRLRFDLMVHDPCWAEPFFQAAGTVLRGALRDRLLAFLKGLPDNSVSATQVDGTMHRIEDAIQRGEVDELREIATRVIARGPNRPQQMEDVFHLTSTFHSSDRYPVDRGERLALYKQLIASNLG